LTQKQYPGLDPTGWALVLAAGFPNGNAAIAIVEPV